MLVVFCALGCRYRLLTTQLSDELYCLQTKRRYFHGKRVSNRIVGHYDYSIIMLIENWDITMCAWGHCDVCSRMLIELGHYYVCASKAFPHPNSFAQQEFFAQKWHRVIPIRTNNICRIFHDRKPLLSWTRQQ